MNRFGVEFLPPPLNHGAADGVFEELNGADVLLRAPGRRTKISVLVLISIVRLTPSPSQRSRVGRSPVT
ncbi:MAG: hypothetical protein KGQ94_04030 [Alphaproteobacteria bacterium]|nr:hypothetical protein [Alphaproteobacteria bacterium]